MQRSLALVFAIALATLALPACGPGEPPEDSGPDGSPDGDSDTDVDGDGDSDVDSDADLDEDGEGPPCPRLPAAADRTRYVVVSHPYDASGAQAGAYEVLELSETGTLSRTGRTFEMGRSTGGVIAFTPDGEVGLVAQGDGTLGVFTLDAVGVPSVLDPAFAEAGYASSVVVAPDGDLAYVLNTGWREHGGGIYSVAIGCDGRPEPAALVAPSKLPYGLVHIGGARHVLAARDVAETTRTGTDAFLVDLADSAAVVASADAFGDDEAIVASIAVTADRAHTLIGDNSGFSGVPNRVAVLRIGAAALEPVQVLTPIEDPVAIVASPFDDVALVVSGFGDAIFVLDRDPADAATPFSIRGQLAYEGGRPALPFGAVAIERGALEGLVLVAENVGVRRVRFRGGGEVEDLGAHTLGEGYEVIVGAIGVQP